MDIQKRLFELQDEGYADFQARLVPNIDSKLVIGVRVPILRKFAKELIRKSETEEFIKTLPHKYYDENMLHAILLSSVKDYKECMAKLKAFLPHVDNWAVCDIISPKIFTKYKDKLLEEIHVWISSKKEYVCRFGIGMLMAHFLDEDFNKEYLKLPAHIKSDKYYINMMLAWFYATALVKQWDDTIIYLEKKTLNKWVHNKTIQKARESYRIGKEDKAYLLSLKI